MLVLITAILRFGQIGVYGTAFDFCDFAVLKLIHFGERRSPENLPHFRKWVHEAHKRGLVTLVGLYCFDRVTHKRPLSEYIRNADEILSALDLSEVDALFLSEENVTWNRGLKVLNGLYDHIKRRYPNLPVYQWLTAPAVPHPELKADGWIYDLYGARNPRFRRTIVKYLVTGKPLIMCINASPGVNDIPTSEEQVRTCMEYDVPTFFFCVDLDRGSPYLWLKLDDPEIALWRGWLFRTIEWARKVGRERRLPLPSAQFSVGDPVEVAGDENLNIKFVEDFSTVGFIDRASISGLLGLRWDGPRGRLVVERGEGAELSWHFVSMFVLYRATFKVKGEGLGRGGLAVEASTDGRIWREIGGADFSEGKRFEVEASLPGFRGRNLWLRLKVKGRCALEGVTFLSRMEPPGERAVILRPIRGRVRYLDDFESRRYLHVSRIEGAQFLEWRPGQISIRGAKGREVATELRIRFKSPLPLYGLVIKVDCYAHKALGAYNELGVSLDGKTLLALRSTRGREGKGGAFRGWLELDLSGDERFQGVREFWAHLRMVNSSGKGTGVSNFVRRLEVEARVSPRPF